MIQQLDIIPTMCRLSGLSELVPLRWHPESVPAIAHLRYPLGRLRVAGWRIASLTRSLVNKNPHQQVRATDGDSGSKTYIGYEPIQFTNDNSNLSGAKIEYNSRPCKGH